MSDKRERVAVICPGRGSYTKEELGYIRNHALPQPEFLADLDERRLELGEPTISELDGAQQFKVSVHTRGEHASPLIYACSYLDFMHIDQAKYEIVVVTGNSMGWYLSLAMAGVLNWEGAFCLIQTMGSMMKNTLIGGQVLYPIIDTDWKLRSTTEDLIEGHIAASRGRLFNSIRLGGYRVIGGEKTALKELITALPPDGDYPFLLINHGAFHTPLMKSVSKLAFSKIPLAHFHAAKIPLVDGRGHIFQPWGKEVNELYEYTLGHQVTETYDFTQALSVVIKEFAPDRLILLGPGGGLGGAIGQVLVQNEWLGLKSKEEFSQLQAKDPFLLSPGRK